jgi:hypothetical protein
MSAPDPIFAAINRHKALFHVFGETCSLADEVVAEQQERQVSDAERALYNDAGKLECEARKAFVATIPLTEQGIIAGLKYAAQVDRDYGQTGHIKKFAKSVRKSPLMVGCNRGTQ